MDPYGSPRPADHIWEGEISRTREGFICEGERGIATVVPIANADRADPIVAEAMRGFEWARGMIKRKGRSMDEEREALYALLAESFEAP